MYTALEKYATTNQMLCREQWLDVVALAMQMRSYFAFGGGSESKIGEDSEEKIDGFAAVAVTPSTPEDVLPLMTDRRASRQQRSHVCCQIRPVVAVELGRSS